jgi:hypothetical protein
MASDDIWTPRQDSWVYLSEKHPSRVSVVLKLFELLDKCVDEYEDKSGSDAYARICGLTLLKAKNLAHGSLSLLLDALGQEAGALLRPFIEYTELLTYFRQFPSEVEKAAENDLPKAGKRAKAIGGMYQEFREHLNEHASHSSYSHFSLSHLLTPELKFRKSQQFVPHVLERNLRDWAVQVWFLLHEAVVGLEHLKSAKLVELATAADALKGRMIHVFELDAT